MNIEHKLRIEAALEQVRAAINTPAGIKGWWAADSDVASEVGGSNILRFVKGDRHVTMSFRIDESGANRIVWTCTGNDNPVWIGTTLTFDLEADGNTTQLGFTHAGFKEDQSPPYKMTVDGWNHFVGSLKAYLETGTGQPW